MKNRIVIYGLHVLGWLAFLFLPYLFAFKGSVDFTQLTESRHDVQNLLTYIMLILFSYLNHLVLVPTYYLSKRYAHYYALVMVCFLVIALVPYWSEPMVQLMPLMPHRPQPQNHEFLLQHFQHPPGPPHPGGPGGPGGRPPIHADLSQILLCIVSMLVSISMQTNNRLHEAETEKLQAELLQLKTQIHPHFLFNTLNSIYALAIRKDDRTPETIVKLAEFMRYIIRDAHHDKVALEKETNYIQNYIDLQRARLRESTPISYTLEGNVSGKQIAPLVLFSFIENAFKHGVNPDEDSAIRIQLTVRDKELSLSVFNKKVKTNTVDVTGGIGLHNARERLKLLYPAAHQLTIDDAPNHFLVDLKLTLL